MRLVLRTTQRGVRGFSGEYEQVRAARSFVGLDDAEAHPASNETRYTLDLDRLVVPAALASGMADGTIWIVHPEGVGRSILFTAEANTPAQRCYENLGFGVAGEPDGAS